MSNCAREMQCYCQYLLQKDADEQSIRLYEIAAKQIQLSNKEEKLLSFVLNNTWSIGCIDAALALFFPKHILRRRLITAFAILETNPLYFSHFKPKQFSVSQLFVLAAAAVSEGCKAIIGLIIISVN